MSGGIYDGHRGGYSSNFDTFSTWKNNTSGLFNEYRIDGSWMDDGDYDKAFKGYPSHKTVNIFMNAGYEEPSLGNTLLSGGIRLGITALGMWAMGLFGRGKSRAQQPSTALNLGTQSYWNRFFNNWNLPSLYGSQTPSDTPAPSSNNQTQQTQQTQQAQQTQQTQQTSTNQNVNKSSVGTASNDKLKTEQVHGKITDIGNNNSDGYPISFKITDTTYSNGDSNKGNVYTYEFDKIDDSNKKPVYKLTSITYSAPKDKSEDITLNTYTIIAGITKGNSGEKGKVDEELTMTTLSDNPAMKNPGETGKGDKRFTYPPTN